MLEGDVDVSVFGWVRLCISVCVSLLEILNICYTYQSLKIFYILGNIMEVINSVSKSIHDYEISEKIKAQNCVILKKKDLHLFV